MFHNSARQAAAVPGCGGSLEALHDSGGTIKQGEKVGLSAVALGVVFSLLFPFFFILLAF
jgi:hypothetical protein